MPRKPQILIIILSIFILVNSGCEKSNRVEILKYKRFILEDRNRKNESFKFAQDSPIPENKRWEFKELNYFPVDRFYKVKALFHEMEDKTELIIPTSSGHSRVYVTVGSFSFSLRDKKMKLMAYQEKAWLDNGSHTDLFVPFTDETSGKFTYGGGRYLDIAMPDDNPVYLDFNLAYNPYCVYNPNYSCPIPPPENHLALEIRAGEKSL